MIKRVDPVGCGCTDCLTGYSKPLDQANDPELVLLITRQLQDATGVQWSWDRDSEWLQLRYEEAKKARGW